MRGAAAVLTMLCLAFPAGAVAEVRSASLQDATGDGSPDLVSASVSYDTSGSIEARATYAAAPPSGGGTVTGFVLGALSGSTCEGSSIVGAFVDAGTGASSWNRIDGDDQADGTARLEGTTLVVNASSPAFANEDVDCVYVQISNSGDYIQAVSLDAPAPADPPPPPPDDPDPPDPPEKVPPKPKPTALERYDAAVAKCKRRKPCLKKAARRNRAGARLARKRRKNPFLGKAFLRTDIDVAGACGGSCVSGWIFTDDRWVHRGVPEGGPAVARCKKVTAKGDRDGCLRYRLSSNHKVAKVGGIRLKLKGRAVVDASKPKQPYTRVAIPLAGARYDAALSSISSFGIPGVNQSFFTSQLQLDRGGRFVTASQASGTNGQGSDFENSYTVVGADKKGRYAFEAGGTLALFFESGRVTRRSALVVFGDNGRLGTVPRDGLFLNGAPYLADDD